jgi:DNA-binding beta-propeller fold protein YncE
VLAAVVSCAWGAQLRQIAVLDIPGRPGFDELAFANGMLVMAHSAGDVLDVFDLSKRRIVQQVPDMSEPHGLAVDPRGGTVYVANARGKNIAVVSATEWKVERTIPLPASPYHLAITADGSRLFAANWQDRSVSVVDLRPQQAKNGLAGDPAGGDRVSNVGLDGSPAGLALDAARQRVFVSLQDTAEVVVVDIKSLAVSRRFKLTASQPTAVLMDAANGRLYVAVRHAVLSLDPATGQELGRVAAPAGADSMWLDPADDVLYVASGGGVIGTYRTGGANLVAQDEIQTEVRGRSVAFDPSRKLIFLPGGREGRSKLLILKQLGPQQTQQLATK